LDWLDKRDDEVNVVEMQKKQFIKREKWDVTIQFHKKKISMIRHLAQHNK